MAKVNVTGIKLPPPLVYVAGFLAGFWLQRWRPLPWPRGSWNGVLGGVLVAGGVLLMVDFVVRFRRAGTAIDPRAAASTLITGGSYRISRNPGYLGWALAYAGAALLFPWTWCLVLLPVVVLIIDRLVIVREERFLSERFGEEYRAYRQRVRRWI